MFIPKEDLARLKKMVRDLVAANPAIPEKDFETVFSREMGEVCCKVGSEPSFAMSDFLIKVECSLVEVEATGLNLYRANNARWIAEQIHETFLADCSDMIRKEARESLLNVEFIKRKEDAVAATIKENRQRDERSQGNMLDTLWRAGKTGGMEPGIANNYFPSAD
ncbi:MAG TPA: hypothetical protein VMD74_00305 [Candidatus Methylomirabilis sp.]|nr:hypothetical protein [Candidatus Methylomirabilis sp.]